MYVAIGSSLHVSNMCAVTHGRGGHYGKMGSVSAFYIDHSCLSRPLGLLQITGKHRSWLFFPSAQDTSSGMEQAMASVSHA